MTRAFSVQFLILAAILGGAAYLYRANVKVFAVQAVYQVAPCSIPLTYSIGSIDPRFGLSTSTLVKAMSAATGAWDGAAGKSLFTYVPSGGILTVNLVYDTRQETTQQLSSIGSTLSGQADSYDAVKAQYDAALSSYQAAKRQFDAAYAAYASKSAAYEQEVRSWNARGGAPEGTYEDLQNQKALLDQEGKRLIAQQNDVNAGADEVNALVGTLNALAQTVNSTANAYNTVGRATGAEFEEAVFESQPGHEEIDVYEYDSYARLARVLAHEFGHSIGLDHVDDQNAIMYRLNQGTDLSPRPEDVSELRQVCRLP